MQTREEKMEYIAKWKKENQDRMELKLPKGQKAEWKAYADQLGISVTAMISKAVAELVEREGLTG